jgi:outer membrane protein assembly factor BamD
MAVFVTRARLSRLPFAARLSSAILFLVVAAACASTTAKKPPTGTPEPDKFLYERGTEELNKRHWVVSREYFRQLVDSYPQSPYRADAKLGVGDTYLGEGTAEADVLAINEFREFLSFYPTHKRADYAQLKLGMAHFYQMRAPERDQTETREAIHELQTFVARYPNSEFIEEGQQHLREARDRLGDAEFHVGVFYYRSKWYPGAIERLKPFVEGPSADPGYTNRDGVYFYLGESLIKMSRSAEALPYFERLVKEFEKSEYLEQAHKRIAELKAATPAKTNGGSK